jgi:hypothetical protein
MLEPRVPAELVETRHAALLPLALGVFADLGIVIRDDDPVPGTARSGTP